MEKLARPFFNANLMAERLKLLNLGITLVPRSQRNVSKYVKPHSGNREQQRRQRQQQRLLEKRKTNGSE